MKNLKLLFDLLLFPFLWLMRLPIFVNLYMYFNHHKRKTNSLLSILFVVGLFFTPTSILAVTCPSNSSSNTCVSIGDVTLNEGNGGGTTAFNFPVSLTKNGGTVNYSVTHINTDNSDFPSVQTGTLVIPNNTKNGTITIFVNADNDVELDETFHVIITASTGIDEIDDGTGLGTIVNDDFAQVAYTLTTGSIQVGESDLTTSIPIRVDPAIYDDTVITVDYTTIDNTALAGSDYTSTSGTLSVDATNTSLGTTIVSIPVAIINDSIPESQEDFNLTISNVGITSTAGNTASISIASGDITINDDDGVLPTLSVNDVTVIENDTTNFMTFTISLSSILNQEVVFSYATVGITATSSVDFLPASGTVTIPANTSNVTVSVLILGDNEAGEGDETLEFNINTSSPLVTLGKDTGIGTIQDDDSGLTLSLNDASIAEKDINVTANVNIRFSQALTADLNLTYSTLDNTAISPDDYNGTNSDINITIPAGSTDYPLQFTIVGDDIQESNEEFTITIENVSTPETIVIAKSSGSVTIFDDDQAHGCSSYIGLMTINEYQNNPNYKDDYHPLANNAGKVQGNFVEIKYLDFLVKQHVNNLWSLSVYTTAGSHILHWDDKDPACIDPRYEVFQMDNNVMGKEGYVVLRDQNGNEVDVLNIDNSNHYSQQCYDFIYDTDFGSSAQNKDLFREPDGTGDWFDHGNGANSGGSRCINRDGYSGGLQFTKFDAIDAGVTPASPIVDGTSVPIQTKIVNKSFDMDILSLDPSSGFLTDSNITVRTYLADGISGERLPGTNPAKIAIFNNNNTINITGYIYGAARKIVRLRFEYCGNDQGAYEDWDTCWNSSDVISISNRRVSHSRNAFAIRPDSFVLTSSDDRDLLRAGKEYNLTISAPDELNNNSTDYNQSSTLIETNMIRYAYGGAGVEDLSLVGDLVWTSDFNITHGISLRSGANDVAGIQYSDVGDISIQIQDKNWAAVDNSDTPHVDCGVVSTWICGEVNATFIPDHFTVSDIHLRNHRDGDFTYLTYNDDLNMSAHLDVNITAMSEDESPTRNFKSGSLYENPITVTLSVPDSTAPLLTKIKQEIATPTRLGFTAGVHLIAWNDSNETQKLMFNYNKVIQNTHQPFIINGIDVDVDVSSIYTDLNWADPGMSSPDANITGGGSADQNATFYYARTRSTKFFYEDIETSSTPTPIAIDVYCDPYAITCVDYGIDTVYGFIGESNWYLSTGHRASLEDGNVTLKIGAIIEGSGSPKIKSGASVLADTADANIESGGIDSSVEVHLNGANVPLTVLIELVREADIPTPSVYTNEWLIHNPDAPIPLSPFYKVRFIGNSSWTGTGNTGDVVNIDASRKKSKRMDW